MKVSIITPSLNQGQFIERTIQSVLSQNIPNLEYLVIDGGSTDQTLAILNQYKNQLHFISEADKGQSDAVNKGLNMASGEIIGWLNSDDIYYPEAIETACQFFKNHPEIDILYGMANHIDINDKILNQYPTEPWNYKRLASNCYISQPAVFFRKRIFATHGLLNESLNYCMDYEYWLRLGKQNVKFGYLPNILAGSRLYSQTKTASQAVAMRKEVINMLKQHFSYVKPRWFLSYAYAYIRATTSLSIYNPISALRAYYIASSEALRINGFLKGLLNLFSFPLELIIFLRRKTNNLPNK